MEQRVVVCNLDDRAFHKLRNICHKREIEVRRVHPKEYGQRLGALCGVREKETEISLQPTPDDTLIVFAHFPPDVLESVLAQFRKSDIGTQALKCVLTETNADWNLYELIAHVRAEHEAMHAQPRPEAP